MADGLDNVAIWLLQEQYLRRVDDRDRPRTRMGLQLRAELFRNLESGVWLDLPEVDRLASHTYDNYRAEGEDKYTGAFVEYTKAFCGAVARYIKAESLDVIPAFAGLSDTLRSIEANGVHVRDGLKLSGIKSLALDKAERTIELEGPSCPIQRPDKP